MQNMIFALASFLIAAFAFGFGAAKLFKRKKPLYLQILVCAAGCFAIEQLSSAVNLWCNVNEAVSIGMFGIFGCNFFLLSANFGTLDRIVDDSRSSKKARTLSVIAPIIIAALAVLAFIAWKDKDMFCAVMWLIMMFPALPASYFNLKHILLPLDPFEFLKLTKPCNIASLVFYVLTAAYAICSAMTGAILTGVFSILMSLSVLALSFFAVRGAERWGI
ncbi:MAG: hypothetical protein KBS52_01410 [Clostridiales bacterium]|nr:hypothetical protein [Candidatus Equinaster intestinalis]